MSLNKPRGQKFDEYRQQFYDEIGYDKGLIFNFIYHNNDIFKMITREDENQFYKQLQIYRMRQTNVLIGSYIGIIFIDQVVLRKMQKIANYRALIFFTKYVFVPFMIYEFSKDYFNNDVQQQFQQIIYKYDFGYNQYNKAMDILERADRVGKLEQLAEQRAQFDWSDIPQFKSKYVIED